jgi:hypothetical protein
MTAVSSLSVVTPVCGSHPRMLGEDAYGTRRTANPYGKRQDEIAAERAGHSLASRQDAYQDDTAAVAMSRNAPRLNAAFIAQVLGQILPKSDADPRRSGAYAQPRNLAPLCDIML